jgi:aryl-alcohol dehydrogenase-like predicted oxidoreductase
VNMEWVLGTAQLGSNYGISNRVGMPSGVESFEILHRAYELGIRTLDTAIAYGLSHQRISEYHDWNHDHRFKIITKINRADYSLTDIEGSIRRLCYSFGGEVLDVLLCHNFEDSLDSMFLGALRRLKENGYVRKIGVSIYGNSELQAAAQNPDLDVIQLPFNLLDSWTIRGDGMLAAKAAGKELHVRSIFLQGLFHMNPENLPVRLARLGPFLRSLREIASLEGISMGSLAVRYVRSRDLVDGV